MIGMQTCVDEDEAVDGNIGRSDNVDNGSKPEMLKRVWCLIRRDDGGS
jgi:hypothetical protein